ncbi:acyl-CoA thioesterase [candidate division GN15 bacterium]|nr:acyl-CoA thioesterase [candidate division GN15 bacterium]
MSEERHFDPKDTEITIYEVVFPSMVNHLGTLFGGTALQWMDRAAWICATRFARKTMVTIASDRVEFKKPVLQGDLVQLTAQVTQSGKTSVTVQVVLVAEDPITAERHLATEGQFVLVAVNKHGRPTELLLP